MDKELAQLHDLTRNMLVDVQRQLMAKQVVPGFSPSDLKKVRKALSSLDFDFQSYGDIMSDNATDSKGLMKALRNQETNVMKSYALLKDDTIHHLVQQRTGGDFGLNVDGNTVRNAVMRLQDRFQMRFGQSTGENGVIRGDTAFSNFAHKSDDRATGLERQAIRKNPDPKQTAHRFGTAGYSKTLSPEELTNADTLVEALSARIQPQLDDVKVGIQTDSPRVQAIRNLDPRLAKAYSPDNTALEINDMKKVIKQLPEKQILQTYKALPIFANGVVKTSVKGLSNVPLLGGSIAAGLALVSGSGPAEAAGAFIDAENPIDGGLVNKGTVDEAANTYTRLVDRKNNPTVADKIIRDPLNELQYAGKQLLGGLRNMGGKVLFGF